MVIDTSALVAILCGEPEAERLAVAIEADTVRLVSAATWVETGIVIESRYGPAGAREFELLLHRARITVMPASTDQSEIALDAWREYSKGRHAAGLNFGDCFSYALARESAEPLLCKGDDFSKTDLTLAAY